jgi:hypothetical protein
MHHLMVESSTSTQTGLPVPYMYNINPSAPLDSAQSGTIAPAMPRLCSIFGTIHSFQSAGSALLLDYVVTEIELARTEARLSSSNATMPTEAVTRRGAEAAHVIILTSPDHGASSITTFETSFASDVRASFISSWRYDNACKTAPGTHQWIVPAPARLTNYKSLSFLDPSNTRHVCHPVSLWSAKLRTASVHSYNNITTATATS